jgi:hypothetical protein
MLFWTLIESKKKAGHLCPTFPYFFGGFGGLFPRPPPEGFPVVLGPFGTGGFVSVFAIVQVINC